MLTLHGLVLGCHGRAITNLPLVCHAVTSQKKTLNTCRVGIHTIIAPGVATVVTSHTLKYVFLVQTVHIKQMLPLKDVSRAPRGSTLKAVLPPVIAVIKDQYTSTIRVPAYLGFTRSFLVKEPAHLVLWVNTILSKVLQAVFIAP